MTPRPPGRHARRPAPGGGALPDVLSVRGGVWVRLALGGCGVFAALLAVALGLSALTASGGGGKAGTAAVRVREAGTDRTPASPSPPSTPAGAGTTDSDPGALAYLRAKDPADAVHVVDVRWSGSYLRVYTDYGETDTGRAPVALCSATATYLADGGVSDPVVFVHAAHTDNGYVVLANNTDQPGRCASVFTK